MTDPRSITRLLQVHPEVDHVDHDLCMALGLHGTPHHTETHQRFPILGDEGGNNRVKGTFTRLIYIVMPFFQGK